MNTPVARGGGGGAIAVRGVGISATLKWTMTSNVNCGLMGKKKDNEDTNKVKVAKLFRFTVVFFFVELLVSCRTK